MVTLDPMELADLVRPEQLVAEILRQNPQMPVPVPIEELARLAGITKIEALTSEGFEGALITNLEKSAGAIFFSARSPRFRQRFTIGHELGHYLLPWHRQTSFNCTADDILSSTNKSWEREANQFSAELLMPAELLKRRANPSEEFDLNTVRQAQQDFQTSLESTARRIVEMSEHPFAVVFSKDNKVRYTVSSPFFNARLNVRVGSPLPAKSLSRLGTNSTDDWFELDSYWWLEDHGRGQEYPLSVYEQTLVQKEGYKVTLLSYES